MASPDLKQNTKPTTHYHAPKLCSRRRPTMSKLMKNSMLALAAALTLVTASTPVAHASEPKAMLMTPGYDPYFNLPKFGFNSFNIGGVGERITYVQWGGLAS